MKKFLSVLFISTLLLIACGPDEPELPAQKKLVLESKSVVNVPVTGGSYTISFYLENASFDDMDLINHRSSENWLWFKEIQLQKEGVDVDILGLAACRVEPNTGKLPREGKVFFTYKDQQIEVTFKQEGATEKPNVEL